MSPAQGILSISDADLAPIRLLLAPLNRGIDLTRLGSWCILPLCCGAFAAQSMSRRMAVFEAIQPHESFSRLIAGDMPPDVLAHSFAGLLKEWVTDRVGEVLARRGLTELYQRKGKTEADIKPHQITWSRLAILLNSYTNLDIDSFTPIRAWADGNSDRWLELSFAAGLLVSVDAEFPYEQLANGEVARQDEPRRTQVREMFRQLSLER